MESLEINQEQTTTEEIPFLSICIPTFNRAKLLERNLASIYSQIGNDSLFEVIVVNNDSGDDTEEVVRAYQEKYATLIYSKNATNIGMSKNILYSLQLAHGTYCMSHGDDDYFAPHTLYRLVEYIKKYPECSVYFLNATKNIGTEEAYEGMEKFLQNVSVLVTAITATIIKREYLSQIVEPDRFIETNLNQVYIIYSILMENAKFLILNQNFFIYQTQPSGERYDWGEVFIKNYLGILDYFRDYGLDEETLTVEKRKLLDEFIMVWYKKLKVKNMNIDFSHTIDYFVECYKDELYFESYYKILSENE
ncbi:MAG: glycosyltransferase family 2 protein [Cellulosilyticaceae bacterium]